MSATPQQNWKPLEWGLDVVVMITLLSALGAVIAFDKGEPVTPVVAEVPVPEQEPEPLPELPPPIEIPELEFELPPPPPVPPPPELVIPEETLDPVDPVPRISVNFSGDLRIGISSLTGNPDDPSDDSKRLTYSTSGTTSNTRVFVDGATPIFADGSGTMIKRNEKLDDGSFETVWVFRDIATTRRVELIPGDVSRRMDAFRISYVLENVGTEEHQAGIRVMIDTLIGNNDGVPFIVPGHDGIVTNAITFREGKVPDFVRALEQADLTNPGVIVDIGLRPRKEEEAPTLVNLAHWPGSSALWDYNHESSLGSDSAIGIYYPVESMQTGEKRRFSFTYGLGSISSTRTRNAKLSLTAGGPFQAGGKFWVVALVQNPKEGQTVNLTLPKGLALAEDDPSEKQVAKSDDFTQISWLVNADPQTEGEVEIAAKLAPDGVEERQKIKVQPIDAQLKFLVIEPVAAGRPFWALARVQHPQPGQFVEVTLPQGLKFAEGHAARKAVPEGEESTAQLTWLIETDRKLSGEIELAAKLTPNDITERQQTQVQSLKSNLTLIAKGPVDRNKPFWVVGLVQNPKEGQSVELKVPKGMRLAKDYEARQVLKKTDAPYEQIPWLLQVVGDRVAGDVTFEATLKPQGLEATTTLEVQAGSLIN